MYNFLMLARELIKRVPKVELHDHLDGGVRIETILDIAKRESIDLPSRDPEKLKDFFIRGCRQKSLVLYLETFAVTTAVMQRREDLERIAYEAVEDLSKENVVYAEIRFAPSLHTERGLSLEEIVEAVLLGLERGKRDFGMSYGLLLCAMRNESPERTMRIASLAICYRDRGIVGLDLAGGEAGFPAKNHKAAFDYMRANNGYITIHAGEAAGPESIHQAIQLCGAHRIGHGVRLIEDMKVEGRRIEKLGSLSQYLLDRGVPMEMCLTSNVGTGAVESYEKHPFPLFYHNGFCACLCSDNRLMSGTDLTEEMAIACEEYGLGIDDLERITLNAMKSAFLHHREKLQLIEVIRKRYEQLRRDFDCL
ncbi:MAG: adenosine deaminase [Spirochaetales bacterium]|nr:adenosine deaminase [Spirochaetales bacterium]